MSEIFGSDGRPLQYIDSLAYDSDWSEDGLVEIRTLNYKDRVYKATITYQIVSGEKVQVSNRTPDQSSQFIWIYQPPAP